MNGIFYYFKIATLVFLAPRFAFLGSFLIVIFHLACTASKYDVLFLVNCFCHQI